MTNAISWFEIPATDLDRATKFYETILGITFNVLDTDNIRMRMFPLDDMMTGVGGAIVDREIEILIGRNEHGQPVGKRHAATGRDVVG